MTDFATDLLWEDEKQPVLPVQDRPRDRQQDEKTRGSKPVAPGESQAERLQRIPGNAALAREAEEAEAATQRVADAARQPERPAVPMPKKEPAKPEAKRKAETVAKAATDPKTPPAAKEKIAKKQAAKAAAETEARRLSEVKKAAAARATALAQVLASFDKDAGKADLLSLALFLEKAPPGIAEETARALARAVIRADSTQRGAIALRIKRELGDRRDLVLSRLLADHLAGMLTVPARAAPPPPPPAPPSPPSP
jgi:hypothetical protein